MFERIKKTAVKLAQSMWSHRFIYAGLAGAYGAGCLGLDKEIVQQIVAALYVALVLKG